MFSKRLGSHVFRRTFAVVASLALVSAVAGSVAAAGNGLGTMSVTPTSVGVGATQNFTFTFTNNTGTAFQAGSQVVLTIPASWTRPTTSGTNATAGHVSVSNSCGASISGIAPNSATGPWYITIPMTCGASTSFTLSYRNATAPTVAGPYTFTTQSQDGGSGLADLVAGSPTVTVFGPVNKLAFGVQPSNAVAGTSIAPSVTVLVQDAGGNTVTT
ncbi:MAG: hypothetical protein ABSD62_08540, partial [Candidatus Limnocylindrales bacterium]